jgi:iron(III) transport system ATP-binding protein
MVTIRSSPDGEDRSRTECAKEQQGAKRLASVELRDLTKRFGSVTVVNNVALRIDHGQLICLLGPSGCGKTTTLRLIAGFLEPTSGEIRVGERLVSSAARTLPPEQRKMSMIFQSYALWPHMTVAENIVYGLRLRKMDRDTIAKKLKAILQTTKLEALAERYPGELSGGQQQRVALARALVVEPETLLLDEPLSNLDANLREEMRFEIRRLHDEYRYTTVYVTHDQSEAMTTADLIAVMSGGKIDQLGTPEDIYDRPQSEFVARFIGSSNVIKGTARDENHISFSGATLRVVGAKLTPNQDAAVAIRQHDIQLSTNAPAASDNTVKATVTRQVFLGANRDYVVETPDGTSLRAVTSPQIAFPPGTEVWLTLPAERCRALLR